MSSGTAVEDSVVRAFEELKTRKVNTVIYRLCDDLSTIVPDSSGTWTHDERWPPSPPLRAWHHQPPPGRPRGGVTGTATRPSRVRLPGGPASAGPRPPGLCTSGRESSRARTFGLGCHLGRNRRCAPLKLRWRTLNVCCHRTHSAVMAGLFKPWARGSAVHAEAARPSCGRQAGGMPGTSGSCHVESLRTASSRHFPPNIRSVIRACSSGAWMSRMMSASLAEERIRRPSCRGRHGRPWRPD